MAGGSKDFGQVKILGSCSNEGRIRRVFQQPSSRDRIRRKRRLSSSRLLPDFGSRTSSCPPTERWNFAISGLRHGRGALSREDVVDPFGFRLQRRISVGLGPE